MLQATATIIVLKEDIVEQASGTKKETMLTAQDVKLVLLYV